MGSVSKMSIMSKNENAGYTKNENAGHMPLHTKNARKSIIYAIFLVATGFFWFGSAFFSYLEVLKANFDAGTAAAIITILSYGAQMLGILLYVFIGMRNKKLAKSKLVMVLSFGLSALGILGSFISSNEAVIIISGILFSFFGTNGVLLGYQFHCMTEKVPQRFYGRAFGFAYAAGSLGTTLLAFAFGGRCPVGYPAALVYVLVILFNLVLILCKDKITCKGKSASKDKTTLEGKSANESAEIALPERGSNLVAVAEKPVAKNLILLLVGVFLVMGFLSSVSDLMQHAHLETSNQVNSAYVRAFFAVGLILAGFLTDYNRRLGAIACLSVHGFSFFLALLLRMPGNGFEAVALSYIFSGFHRVFQVVSSMDMAKKATRLFYFSVFGYFFSRLGEVLVSLPHNYVQFNMLRETFLASIFFVALLLLFFPLMKKLYDPVLPEPALPEPALPTPEAHPLPSAAESLKLTARETEVFAIALEDVTIAEIAERLFISEITVKRHVSSILKKANLKSRMDLIARYSK